MTSSFFTNNDTKGNVHSHMHACHLIGIRAHEQFLPCMQERNKIAAVFAPATIDTEAKRLNVDLDAEELEAVERERVLKVHSDLSVFGFQIYMRVVCFRLHIL